MIYTPAEQLLAPLEELCSIDSCSTIFILWEALLHVQGHYIIVLYHGNKRSINERFITQPLTK
jgi:hypothetical protein